ncbi:MAG: helix-turn-helix transcriptional regulator [Planctomycetes bacterium]|nr:helix-turn-helix transcriptional regulator [Planctomycetota bacterium]
MSKYPPPATPSSVIVALAREAKRLGLTAYAIAKTSELPVSTVQRALDGLTSPTLVTVEAVADALGMEIKVQRR